MPVQGVTVGALAAVNLVQGIPAGDGNTQQQYPSAVPNLYTSYNGTTGYGAPASTGTVVVPGRGFFWLFYDQDIPADGTLNGGGTSQSYALPARQLTATGTTITANTTTQAFAASANGFYMAGNPFAETMTANNVTATVGTIQNAIQTWQPTGLGQGTYVVVNRDAGTPLPTWTGFFVEGSTTGITLQYARSIALTGTTAGRTVSQGVQFTLAGTTASGVTLEDRAAALRIVDGAGLGWDVDDASKLTPLTATYALVAPVGERDGAAYRQALLSLPSDATAAGLYPLAFTATEAGTYTLTADVSTLPQGWSVELRDLVTGAMVDAAAGYTFTADATDWTDRFVLAVTAGAVTAGEPTAAQFALTALAPNPTTGRSTLSLTTATSERVTAEVYDALGRRVATVYNGQVAAGVQTALTVDAASLAPGAYVVRVTGETFAETRRLTVVR